MNFGPQQIFFPGESVPRISCLHNFDTRSSDCFVHTWCSCNAYQEFRACTISTRGAAIASFTRARTKNFVAAQFRHVVQRLLRSHVRAPSISCLHNFDTWCSDCFVHTWCSCNAYQKFRACTISTRGAKIAHENLPPPLCH